MVCHIDTCCYLRRIFLFLFCRFRCIFIITGLCWCFSFCDPFLFLVLFFVSRSVTFICVSEFFFLVVLCGYVRLSNSFSQHDLFGRSCWCACCPMLCLWHLYWTSVAGCLCCLRDVLSSRCRYASGAMVSTVYLRYINTCYCTYLWIFLMYTFFQKKKKRLLLKTFLQFKLARRVRSRFSTNFDLIEAEGVLRPYTATQLTDVGRTSLPFGFFDFMVLFNMRHLFFDFFRDFFFDHNVCCGLNFEFFWWCIVV